MKVFEISNEEIIPQELLQALEQGKTIQVDSQSIVGWIDLDEPEFRCGVTYRIKPDA